MEATKHHIDFRCNPGGPFNQFVHFWEHCVGSCHAPLALRADWQRQLTRCHSELGFRYVRFHGLLSDDMGTLVKQKGELIYSFFNADQIFDFLLSIKVRPFIELSFMPAALSSGSDTVFRYKANVNPPEDYRSWENLIRQFTTHLQERYGADEVAHWFFEVWNEPNLKSFWRGTQADYFRLYRHTAQAIKSVNRRFKVGGPATAGNEWIEDFICFCQKNELPADFITTHHYPTDAFGKPGDDTVTQLAQSRRSVLKSQAKKVKEQARGVPVYYTEWNSSSNPFDEMHDEPYAAAFIVKTVMEAHGLAEGYSYWTFSDIFEEDYFSSVPFHGGFGLLNIHGIPKPAYRAFEMLHHLGNESLYVDGKHDTVDVWAIRKKNTLNILITNWGLPRHPIKPELVRINLDQIAADSRAVVEMIDTDHANAPKAWKAMGSPRMLTPDRVKYLEAVSAVNKRPLPLGTNPGGIYFELTMPVQAIANVTITIK